MLQFLLVGTAGVSLLIAGCEDASQEAAEAGADAAAAVQSGVPGEAEPSPDAGQLAEAQADEAGETDPDITELPRLDLAGLQKLVDEAKAQDQVLVVDFWATWCVPCIAMFDPLHEAMAQHGSRVRMVSVTLDAPGDTEQKAIEFLHEHHALKDAYMMVPDTDARFALVDGVGDEWSDLVVPVVLVFEDGELAGEFLGSDAQVDAIARKVKSLVQ